MWSLSLVMSECSLSGHGQGHMSNFYVLDLENFATASRRYTGDIHNSSVVGLFMTPIGQWKRLDRVMVECTFISHCPNVTLQLHNFDLFKTCRTSSSCTVAWQLARFQLTRRTVRSLADSWASCLTSAHPVHTQYTALCRCVLGVGGQIDFMRGAALCLDGLGKPILAMSSATKKGETKIVPVLKPGQSCCC